MFDTTIPNTNVKIIAHMGISQYLNHDYVDYSYVKTKLAYVIGYQFYDVIYWIPEKLQFVIREVII